MIPVVSALVVALLGYVSFAVVRALAQIARQRSMAYKVPGVDGSALLGAASEMMHMKDSSEIVVWQLEKAAELRAQGHDMMRMVFGNEVIFIPLTGEALKPILESKEEITKGIGYDFVLAWLGEGLLLSSGEKWHARRRLITPTFHFRHLENYMTTFNRHSKVLLDVVDNSGREFDIMPFIKRCALDIICDAAMGATVDAQHNPDDPFVIAVRDMLWLTTEYSFKVQNWLPLVWRLSGKAALEKHNRDILHAFTRQIIDQRMAARAGGQKQAKHETNFLDMLLESSELDYEGVREEVDTFMFEGHDTTSTGVCWALWCLAHHPRVQQRLFEEIVDVVGADVDVPLTSQHLKRMPYLDLVQKEAFRLYSPVPEVNRRLQNDFQCGRHLLPKGGIVTIAPIILSRDPLIWGPDALEFKPKRFAPENEQTRHAFDYIPFSAGPRNCIGQRFAILEAKVMLASIVRAYTMHASLPFEKARFGTEAILRPIDGIPISMHRRK